jgi:hypothetical protein
MPTVVKPAQSNEPSGAALEKIIKLLMALNPESRRRVVDTVRVFFGL